MKLHKDDSTLQKVLHSRQLGLKLIANVTYGYTSANYSGRMPCVEVGVGKSFWELSWVMQVGKVKFLRQSAYGDSGSVNHD